jgi:hypothetical protein
LADTEEYVIAELLDGLVVTAGRKNGFDDETWRRRHEDIGPTGPYAPKNQKSTRATASDPIRYTEVRESAAVVYSAMTTFFARWCFRFIARRDYVSPSVLFNRSEVSSARRNQRFS